MNKKLTLERRDELLKKLQKEVPSIDWKFQRLETKGMYFNIDKEDWVTEELYNTLYVFKCEKDFGDDEDTFSKVSGQIQIEYRNDESLDIQCFFNDEVSYINKQRGVFGNWNDDETEEEQWDKVREFFKTYMIPISKRIETKLQTPRIDEMYRGLHQCYKYEFNEILLKTILEDEDDRKQFTNILNSFENEYRELMKKTKSKEEYEKIYKNKNKYFGEPIDMIKSFLEDKVGDLEYYLEDLMERVKNEEIKTIKN